MPIVALIGFVFILDEIIAGFLGEVLGGCCLHGIFEAIFFTLCYPPGLAALQIVTLGKYPPDFGGAVGKFPAYLIGVGCWVAAGFLAFSVFGIL